MDPGMNDLLKWSIENSSNQQPNGTSNSGAPTTQTDSSITQETPREARQLNSEALAQLFGGPSDADLMRDSLTALTSPNIPLDAKLTAFDNLEQLIESVDNANNLDPLGLWPPLVSLLSSSEPELQMYTAWCIGTAVQNNVKAQETLLRLKKEPAATNGAAAAEHDSVLAQLVTMSLQSPQDEKVKRKCVYAISSEVRNFQPAVDVLVDMLKVKGWESERAVDASDMDAIDKVLQWIREH